MAIPRGFIRKSAKDNTVYMEGLALSATPFSHEIAETPFAGVFQVRGTFPDDNSHVVLELDNENELIEHSLCTCQNFTESGNMCKHIVALLLKIENDFFPTGRLGKSENTPIKTDVELKALMTKQADRLKARSSFRLQGDKALFVPLLHKEKDTYSLSFKIGIKRTYVVKDLEELYQNLSKKTVAPCGKYEQFIYDRKNFQNPALIDFFMTYYPFCRRDFHPKEMPLTNDALRKFIHIVSGEKISCDGENITLIDGYPRISLFIKKTGSYYRLNINCKDLTILGTEENLLIEENNTIYACPEDFSDACKSLLHRFCGQKTPPIITEKYMQTFYSMVLKSASKFITIESKEKDFIPPALQTKIYVDMEEKHISAKVEFCYDNISYPAFYPERNLNTVLDIDGESQVESIVKAYLPLPGKTTGTAMAKAEEETLFSLIYEGFPALSKIATLYVSENLKKAKVRTFPKATVGVKVESDLLKLDFSIGDLSPAVIYDALAAYKQKKKYVRLKDGSFLLLDSEELESLYGLFTVTGIKHSDIKKNNAVLPLYRTVYLDNITGVHIVKDKTFTNLVDTFTRVENAEKHLPQELQSVLRDYQKQGFSWLYSLSSWGFGGILADDMGLGKTLQILSLLLAHKQKSGKLKALVVCPASLILNWESEIRHFTPALKTLCMLGNNTERADLFSKIEKADIIITSYDLLKRDITAYLPFVFDYEIIDEAQYIKNFHTQNAKAVKSVQAKTRFALTGTPIENTISELWSIFDFLMPGYLYRYSHFKNTFESPILRDGNKNALKELKKMIAPFVLRRIKKDVLKELPPKTETVLTVGLAPEQEKLYRGNLLSMKKELEVDLYDGQKEKNRIMVLAMLMRLRQLCCDPKLLYENYKETSGKLDLCLSLIETSVASGHKSLLFSQFTSMLSVLEPALKARNIPYYKLTGNTKKEERLALVNAFNSDNTPVFLISLKAGGTGLNLTGADVVIHYDPWWNLSAQNQATDRTHRIGQKNMVSVYKLIAKNTVEEKILALAEKKQRLAEEILPDEGSFIKGLSKDQIMDLFNF